MIPSVTKQHKFMFSCFMFIYFLTFDALDVMICLRLFDVLFVVFTFLYMLTTAILYLGFYDLLLFTAPTNGPGLVRIKDECVSSSSAGCGTGTKSAFSDCILYFLCYY